MNSFLLFILWICFIALAKFCVVAETDVENYVHRRLSVQSYSFDVGKHEFTVPEGVTTLSVTLSGASGGNANNVVSGMLARGGRGGIITADIHVVPGELLLVYVGGAGTENGQGGYNGGGDSCYDNGHPGGSGGGATDIRRAPYELGNRLVVGGGGGGAYSESTTNGGSAGLPNGENGKQGSYASANPAGGGGTQDAGGQPGYYCNGGDFGQGAACCNYYGAGGGGGYFGGGGAHAAAGGGGSNFAADGYKSSGVAFPAGNGSATLTWFPATAESIEFNAKGQHEFTVPIGVTTLSVLLSGASGGDSFSTDYQVYALGGRGGLIRADILVEPGEVLRVFVGGAGVDMGEGGFNGGGDSCYSTSWPGASGGGATDIRRAPYELQNRLVVAGGGGGGYSEYLAYGGNGGYPNGEEGGLGDGSYVPPSEYIAGGGGTQTGGGHPGTSCYEGYLGVGAGCCDYYGAAGGGGYYGGGGAYAAAGGGGSSYAAEGYISSGVAFPAGDGRAILSWAPSAIQSVTFSGVGIYDFVVPDTVTTLFAILSGASGGSSINTNYQMMVAGGLGGMISAEIHVQPTEMLRVFVGGAGAENSAGGFNGGGGSCYYPSYPGGSGGGATDIRRAPYDLQSRVVVAGGGGGAFSEFVAFGGNAGYPIGENGRIGDVTGASSYTPGGGGSQNAGGNTSFVPNYYCYAGTFGEGAGCCNYYGAGGGGGYFGGGGSHGAGGGGGSSYAAEGFISSGVAYPAGNGSVTLFWIPSSEMSAVFTNTGDHEFVVPDGVTSLSVTLYGASGGDSYNSDYRVTSLGGKGGMIVANIAVQPGENLRIFVGGMGVEEGDGGFNGGGNSCYDTGTPGASGGGATDIRRAPYGLADRLVVAGGGGGAFSEYIARGGSAGWPQGQEGGRGDGTFFPASPHTPGGGGSQNAGGSGNPDPHYYCYSGTFGFGSSCCYYYGAGGGGGYYGGGGAYGTGGGGGSSYAIEGFVSAGIAFPAGNGKAILSWIFTPSATPSMTPSVTPTRSPSVTPTMQPSALPSINPSKTPTIDPSASPSTVPSCAPSATPSCAPTVFPTLTPSVVPTVVPSCTPSCAPSRDPTMLPTLSPSCTPSTTPTIVPTVNPSRTPSVIPTVNPSCAPTVQPTVGPSLTPTVYPTTAPTATPTALPTSLPSSQPSSQPSASPSGQPTRQPSRQPVGQPTSQPSRQPIGQPTSQPSAQPSRSPTAQPSRQPSRQPTGQPSGSPSSQPSRQPSGKPTGQPTAQPSRQPSAQPSGSPSTQPSRQPSRQPSGQPSGSPSSQPSMQPSSKPTGQPTTQPSRQPSAQPSGGPTSQPSGQPSRQPSAQPSSSPSSQPTRQPSSKPTGQPTAQPSRQPSAQPSGSPTCQPSRQPSRQPSGQPSCSPSSQPSTQPSASPTGQPTTQPSRQPSSQPSGSPTSQPSVQPSRQPSGQPSSGPTSQPSRQPSGRPTGQPTAQPSRQPSSQPSSSPTSQPSRQPSTQPSGQPSSAPSAQPSRQPSGQPTGQPSTQPSCQPSAQPSGSPTAQPSRQPSAQPSRQPSSAPSAQPSRQPSGQPTRQPTSQPSRQPSVQPSSRPSAQPSGQPSAVPSGQPSGSPTRQPSAQPSCQPSRQPSSQPSAQPSRQPTTQPSGHPSAQPSGQPSRQPTAQPSTQPSAQPSRQPTVQPSGQPSAYPSMQPSAQPTSHPSGQPSRQPSAQPSRQPSAHPSAQPSGQPSSSPSAQPSAQPSCQPTIHPSRAPTAQPSIQPTDQPSSAPSGQPSSIPSGQPSVQPSGQPSIQPSALPSSQPSSQPSSAPSTQPSAIPSAQPSQQPSSLPSAQPSAQPSVQPSGQPSALPSQQPTTQPSSLPSAQPSAAPSAQPTAQPSSEPSGQPTSEPSAQPSVQPSALPTTQPSSSPTSDPTSQPSAVPSNQPTSQPTTVPSAQPSARPSAQPSSSPTAQPSVQPTTVPSTQPSGAPSAQPSGQPSSQPSGQPSSFPSGQPSTQPSCKPSGQPSGTPSSLPSSQPSSQPSAQPSRQPLGQPTSQPSRQPSAQPSRQPVCRPSGQPSGQPTSSPTSAPTVYETSRFIYSRSPSVNPTRSPTLSERSSWFNDLQTVLTDLPKNDTSAVALRSTYYELDVASSSPFRVFGGCSAWSTAVNGDMKPAQFTHKVSSVTLKAIVDRNSNEFSESLVTPTAQCSDAAVATSIVSAMTGSAIATSRTFQCGADAWVMRHCPVSGTTGALSPAVCVNCVDPCSAVQQCNLASSTAVSTASVLAVSPCVQQQCSGDYVPATAIRVLSVGYVNLEEPPRLVTASITATKSTVQVTAQLSSQGSLAAAIYRVSAAVSAPASVNAVLLQNVGASTNAANMTTLTFTGLDAITSYRVYFLTTSLVGVRSTLVDVLGTMSYIDTLCCKTVTGTLSATSAIERQAFSNILTLRLSSAPTFDMIVSIQLFAVNTTGTVSVYSQSLFPSTMYVPRIASVSTLLRASLPSLPIGIYEYRVVLSGEAAGEFTVEYTNNQNRIEVLSAFTEPPVPVLSSATFARDGSFVSIAFSADTNRGNTATSFVCSALFDFACSATSKCQWTDAATVRVSIQGTASADSCARPGSQLTLSSSAQIKAMCHVAGDTGNGNACPNYSNWAVVSPAASLTMVAPAVPLMPTVAISSPSVLGGCDGLSLDVSGSSGSGGRTWATNTITVSGVQNANLTALTSFLGGITVLTPPPVIPAALFVKGTQYNFAVTLCNFLGQCGVGYKQVLVMDDVIPSVTLPGAALRTLSRKDILNLASSAFVATCDGKTSSAGLVYKWSLSSNGAQLLSTVSTSRDASKYLLPAFSLSAGVFYQVSLTVGTTDGTQSSSASVQVFVQPGNIVAVMQGGSARTMRVADTLRVDASNSYDEDLSGVTGWAAGLQYQWSCVQVAPVFRDNCAAMFDAINLQDSRNPWYDLTALSPAADTSFEITVTMTDGARQRTASSTVKVSVLPELAPVVSVAALNAPLSGIINAGQLLQLSGTVSVPASYGGNATWKVSDASIDLSAVALFPVNTAIASVPGAAANVTTFRAVYMAFPANSLPSGSTLTFSLVGTIPYQGKQAVGSVTITVNAPPTPGSFYVSPDSGEELSQLFQFVALNWVDPDLPITYQFEYAASNGASVVVRSKLELSYGSFLLPAGSVESNRTVPCIAQIFDALGANASSSYTVVVTQGALLNATEVQNFVASSLADASVNADSIKQAAALSSYLLNAVNCTLAPNCSALHRKSCLSTAHTCGVCESLLYVGEEGDSNEACYSRADLVDRRRLSGDMAVINSCPAGCSGHGTCVHVHADSGDIIDTNVSPCLEGDVKCLAVCDCEDAYYGSDACEFSVEQLQQRQSSRALVVSGLQTLVGLENPDEQVFSNWVNSLSQASQVPSDMSDAAALTVLSLVDTVTAASTVSVSPQTASSLLNAVNSVAAASTKSAMRRRLSDRRHRRLSTANADGAATVAATRDVLNSVGALLAQSMLPDQAAAQFTQGELRMSVQVLSGAPTKIEDGSVQEIVSVAIPQTALEQALQLPSSQVSLPRNFTSDQGVNVVATSVRSEHFQHLGQDLLSNPLQLYASAQLCAAPPCYVDVVLQNSEATDFVALNQDADLVEVHEITCLDQDYTVHDFTCQNGEVLSVQCTGVAATVSQQCPVVHYAGACNSLSGSADAVLAGANSGCSVLSFTDTSVTCRCAVPSAESTRRALQSLQGHNFTAPAGYSVSYVSMLAATADSFASTILTADNLNASTVTKGWRSLATLGTLAAAIFFALFWSHHADRQAKRVKPAEGEKFLSKKDSSAVKMLKTARNSATLKKYRFNSRAKRAVLNAELQIVEDSLPRVLSSRTFSDRFLEEVKQHHRWFGIVFYFSDSFPRVLRVVSLATNAIVLLFIQSITYNLTNPDDGSCATFDTEVSCLEPKSSFATGESMCGWVYSGNNAADGSCVYIEPDGSIKIVLFVAIFCAIVTTPIAMSADWVILHILSAPTREEALAMEIAQVGPAADILSTSTPSLHSTEATRDGELTVAAAPAAAVRPGLVQRTSSASNLMSYFGMLKSEAKVKEDKLILAASKAELLMLSMKLKKYRDGLRADELEEFNILWGLDAEGKFIVKSAVATSILGRMKALIWKPEEVNVKEAVLMDLTRINAAVRDETAILKETHARKHEIGKKLLFLFQCDLLPGISGKILELKGSRDSSNVKHVSFSAKVAAWAFLFFMNAGMMFYIFLFALTQTGPKQNAWFQSFAMWLVLEIVFVSTIMVLVTHILIPSLVMKDLTQIKRRLMDNIRDFNDKVSTQKDVGLVKAEDDENVPFNAANYLFVSTRLARQFPDLKESKIISQFSTPWPRQSYLHVQNVSKGYSKKFSALTRSASILIIFFVGNFLSIPPGLQDTVMQIVSTTGIGYIVLVHVQLFKIFPALVILPALVLAVLVHFAIQSSKADAKIKLARLFPSSNNKKSKVHPDTESSGPIEGTNAVTSATRAVPLHAEQESKEDSDSDFNYSNFSEEDNLDSAAAAQAQPVGAHRTRRQSIAAGLDLLRFVHQNQQQPSCAEGSDSSNEASSSDDSAESSGNRSNSENEVEQEEREDGGDSNSSSADDSSLSASETDEDGEDEGEINSSDEEENSDDEDASSGGLSAQDVNCELLHTAVGTAHDAAPRVLDRITRRASSHRSGNYSVARTSNSSDAASSEHHSEREATVDATAGAENPSEESSGETESSTSVYLPRASNLLQALQTAPAIDNVLDYSSFATETPRTNCDNASIIQPVASEHVPLPAQAHLAPSALLQVPETAFDDSSALDSDSGSEGSSEHRVAAATPPGMEQLTLQEAQEGATGYGLHNTEDESDSGSWDSFGDGSAADEEGQVPEATAGDNANAEAQECELESDGEFDSLSEMSDTESATPTATTAALQTNSASKSGHTARTPAKVGTSAGAGASFPRAAAGAVRQPVASVPRIARATRPAHGDASTSSPKKTGGASAHSCVAVRSAVRTVSPRKATGHKEIK